MARKLLQRPHHRELTDPSVDVTETLRKLGVRGLPSVVRAPSARLQPGVAPSDPLQRYRSVTAVTLFFPRMIVERALREYRLVFAP